MKRLILLSLIIIFIDQNSFGQSVGISGTSITPNSYSLLELRDNTKGILLPRHTNAERATLGSSMGPTEEGMVVYDTQDDLYYYWDGYAWVAMGTSAGAFVENQNAYQQIADFNIAGDGITSKLGVGTGMAALGAQAHVHDGDPAGGNTMLLVDDYVNNPIMSIIDYGHVGFGTATPNNNAVVDITGNQGVLLPRMSNTAMINYGTLYLGLLDEGMIVYDLTNQQYNWWDGTNWIAFGAATGSYIDNQNAVLQAANYRIAGLGVASQMGIGTGMGAILASNHIHDDNTAAGNQLFLADDYVGNPIMSVFDVGNIGIGNNTPNPNAILDVRDANRGVLLPRLNTAQKAALTTGLGIADEGLMIYDLNLQTYDFWDGAAWSSAATGPGAFIDNQNTGVQAADFNIGGIGVANKMGIGTGMAPVIGLTHIHDNSPTAGSRLLNIDDFVGNPIMSVMDLGQVGLGTTAPAGSAILDMNSNNKGFLPPRMTAAQRVAIAGPVQGLVVYQTNAPEGLWFFDGFMWQPVATTISSIIAMEDADADTKIEVEQSPDDDIIHFTNQGVEYFDFDGGRFNINNTGGSVFIGQGAGSNDDLSSNRNIEIGHQAGNANTTGAYNTDIGYQAGAARTAGNLNTHIGYKSGTSNTGDYNTSVGAQALEYNTTGSHNTAIGESALISNTIGDANTAVGEKALASNDVGTSNVALGRQSMDGNTSGSNNVAAGTRSLYSNSSGSENSAFGHYSLNNNSTGSYNTAIGTRSLYSNTASNNTAIGWESQYSGTTGNYNVALGNSSLRTNTTGEKNAALGFEALKSATTADQNTAVGARALTTATTGSENTVVGHNAGYSTTTGNNNTAMGSNALYTNTTGGGNTAIGYETLYLSDAPLNTAVGYRAMKNNSNGIANCAFGAQALASNSSGANNSSFGVNSLDANTSGSNNSAFGISALTTSTTASNNTALGHQALFYTITGYHNVAVGSSSGNLNTSGYYNTFLGSGTNGTGTNYNSTAIGYGASTSANNEAVIGNASVTSIGGYANWTNLSDGRCKQNIEADVPGLEFVNKLRPVTYNMDLDALAEIKGTPDSLRSKKDELTKEQIVYTGLIAQEVELAAKELDYDFSGVDAPQNENDHYALRYAEFVAPLIKSVQELHEMNRDLLREIEVLRKQVARIDNKTAEK